MVFDVRETEEVWFKFLGLKFEPLFLPLRKRWESLCVAFYILGLLTCGPFMPFIMYYVIFHSRLWPLLILYFCWFIYDRKTARTGGRKLCLTRNKFLAKKDYFPATLMKTVDLPPTTSYLLTVFPHGILCFGVLSHFLPDVTFKELFPGLEPRAVVLNALFNTPFIRDFLLCCGISSASARNIMTLLNSDDTHKAVVLMVGGAAECMLSEPWTNKVVINNRKGFVKLALQSGVPLVPVYSFGENDVYDQYRGKRLQQFQNFVRKWLGVPPIIVKGRGFFQHTFGILPHRKPITTVVGKPIPIPKIENPTEEVIDEYHAKFVSELKAHFDAHKEKYDANGSRAELICL